MDNLFQDQAEARHFESIRLWIYNHTGLHYPKRKFSTLYHRLQNVCRQFDFDNLKELDEHLRKHDMPELTLQMADAVSTNHTFFFREADIFQFFQQQILPTLPPSEHWRLWSAACSSGDEAFTLAILLAETLGLLQAQQKVNILGTDISQVVLEQAEYGITHARRLEQIPAHWRESYFRPVGLGQWQVIQAIQQMCTFRRLNLMSSPWPFRNQFHVIFCRNVLYYFDQADQQMLVERLYDFTLPGGWLITSVTESLRSMQTRWHVVETGIYRKI
ncbi:MAG: protein-glutamate O-methyltransferase CheR [Anaerolineae bacterium]|nr:protein-glutamate O-methyltransferase CheR [Anaerolineae bacterium]